MSMAAPRTRLKRSVMDWIMHGITIFWKLLFAFIPPTDFLGGWLCFFVSLCGIAGVTVMIGDLAGLLGCSMGIDDSITAITFVALGTSLPDTFASKSGAVEDPYADAAVANVTGSNSVNVFLGLGLPWMIASIYWTFGGASEEWRERIARHDEHIVEMYPNGAFVVMAGDLGFSVMSFSSCAAAAIAILAARRSIVGGELGGPHGLKWASAIALVLLWVIYLSLSIWKTLSSGGDESPPR